MIHNPMKMTRNKVGRKKGGKIDRLLEIYPTMLHTLYRFAIKVLGPNVNSVQIVSVMNQ